LKGVIKVDKKVEQFDVVVIGGGAAGMTAAIYCGRARLKTLLIEKSLLGGLATYTNEIENYPGFPEGQTGLGLMKLFEQQAKKFGVKIKLTDVKGVQLEGKTKIVETFRVNYEAKAVIIATGGKPRLTGAINEQKFLFDKGISFCATCDAARFTDKEVLVVGSGDAAIEEGMFLTKFAKKVRVSVIHDEGIMDANKIAQEQALKNPKMEFIWNTMVDEYVGEDILEQVILKNVKTGEKIPVRVDGCFLFIGYIPNTEIFKGQINMSQSGYIITNENMETNIPGVFAAGDVREKFLKQVATAVGDGAIAGVGAEKYIAETEIFENEILRKDLPGMVYLWCATDEKCRKLLTLIEQVEQENNHRLCVNKIDIYKKMSMAERLGVVDAPCCVFIKEGKVVKILKEDISKETIDSILQEIV
jgi:thioredoxin reductase (NADPH)